MTRTTRTNDAGTKGRAVFLAVMMVLSVVAMTTAFVGSVAAGHDETDAVLQAGNTYWQGQSLNLTDGNIEVGDTYQIRTDDDANTLVRERTVQNANHTTISTSGLDGNYNLTWVDEGSATPNPSPSFEVVPQDLSSSFEDASIGNSGSPSNVESDLTIGSNRGSFQVNVTATVDGTTVEADDLNATFPTAIVNGTDTTDDIVTLDVSGGDTYTLNFTDRTAGNWEFDFEVTDTDATSSANISVQDIGAGQASFAQGTTDVTQGDVAEIEVQLNQAAVGGSGELVIGNFDTDGYQANVTFTDGDADGTVTIEFNTYTAGNQSASASDIVGVADSDDSVQFNPATDQSSLPSNMLSGGDYEVFLSTSADDPAATIDTPDGFGTLFISERSTDGMTIWTAPHLETFADAEDINNGVADGTVTQDDTVAMDDYAIVQFNATGLEGLVSAYGLDAAVSQDLLNVSVEQANPAPNREPKELNLSNSAAQLTWIPDAENDSYYLVVDLNNNADWERNGTDVNLASEDEWNTTIEIRDNRLLRSTDPDDHQAISGEFEAVSRTLRWTLAVGGVVQVEPAADQVVRGASSLAAGTEVQLRLQSTGDTEPRFVKTGTATVQPDGTWSSSFDFSSQSIGDTFSSRARVAIIDPVTEDGEVVEQVQQGTAPPRTVIVESPTPQFIPVTVIETREVTRRVTVRETIIRTVEGPGQPGFGIAVAIVALLAAALLAVRRRD